MEPNSNNILAGKKVLWIEDDAFLSEIVAKKLSAQDGTLLQAKSGQEAFTILENEQPDIIMLDILLPGMNGYEILEKIKGDSKTATIPVVILSNFGQTSEVEKGLRMGASKYIVKATLTLDQIIEEIKKTFEETGGVAAAPLQQAPPPVDTSANSQTLESSMGNMDTTSEPIIYGEGREVEHPNLPPQDPAENGTDENLQFPSQQ